MRYRDMVNAQMLVAASARRMLVPANLMLVGLLVIHALDHALRQDAPVPAAAQVVGIVGTLAALVSLGVAARARRPAPLVTAVVGFSTAVGFVAVHLLPDWGPFSQPYQDLGVDAVSWSGLLLPIVGAALVGGTGIRAARDPLVR